MIVDKAGNIFEDRRKSQDRRKKTSEVEGDKRKKEDRRKEDNKIRRK